MMPNKEKKDRDAFAMVDGEQTDKGMHDIDDDEDFMKRINEHYRVVYDSDVSR